MAAIDDLITKVEDRFYRLPIDNEPVRRQLLAIQGNDELDRMFDQHGKKR